jgi:nucleotide-binding universal stress UspA family protein
MTLTIETPANVEVTDKRDSTAMGVKNVLFATDFSSTSEAALPYAAAICRRFGSTLHTAHIISDANLLLMTGGVDYVSMGTIYEDANTEAQDKIREIEACFEGIPHRAHVRHGQVWKNLAQIIEENEIDLIAVGTHGRTGLGKLLLGSVAENILRHASCPVLTVGPKVSGRAKLPALQAGDLAPAELELRQILYATNFAQSSVGAASTAALLAQDFGSRLTLMHVIEDYTQLGSRPGPIEESICRLRNLVPSESELQYEPETLMEFGEPAKCILRAASGREADLIVLGARPAEELVGTTHMPWTTAHRVIASAKCPVLTIRG